MYPQVYYYTKKIGERATCVGALDVIREVQGNHGEEGLGLLRVTRQGLRFTLRRIGFRVWGIGCRV